MQKEKNFKHEFELANEKKKTALGFSLKCEFESIRQKLTVELI